MARQAALAEQLHKDEEERAKILQEQRKKEAAIEAERVAAEMKRKEEMEALRKLEFERRAKEAEKREKEEEERLRKEEVERQERRKASQNNGGLCWDCCDKQSQANGTKVVHLSEQVPFASEIMGLNLALVTSSTS